LHTARDLRSSGAALAWYGAEHGNIFLRADPAFDIGRRVLVVSLLALVIGAIGLVIGAIVFAIQRLRSSDRERPANGRQPELPLFFLGLFLGVPAGAVLASAIVAWTRPFGGFARRQLYRQFRCDLRFWVRAKSLRDLG
jgi:hypothetical protein